MSYSKSFGLAMFAAACALGETMGSAHAQCSISSSGNGECATEWSGGSVIDLGGPGSTIAFSINNVGQAVGVSTVGFSQATEWSGGSVISLGGPGSIANSINNAGQAVGVSVVGGVNQATEWSNGSVIGLGGLPGSSGSGANSINNLGQAVGASVVGGVG
jgi:uncharacterized membrane protein